MPLNFVVLLPGRRATVHSDGTCWSAKHLAERGGREGLEASVREGVRQIPDCGTAKDVEADVVFTEYRDGEVEAVARVLCDNEHCAAVAERYQPDDEQDQAEAALTWALGDAARTWADQHVPGLDSSQLAITFEEASALSQSPELGEKIGLPGTNFAASHAEELGHTADPQASASGETDSNPGGNGEPVSQTPEELADKIAALSSQLGQCTDLSETSDPQRVLSDLTSALDALRGPLDALTPHARDYPASTTGGELAAPGAALQLAVRALHHLMRL